MLSQSQLKGDGEGMQNSHTTGVKKESTGGKTASSRPRTRAWAKAHPDTDEVSTTQKPNHQDLNIKHRPLKNSNTTSWVETGHPIPASSRRALVPRYSALDLRNSDIYTDMDSSSSLSVSHTNVTTEKPKKVKGDSPTPENLLNRRVISDTSQPDDNVELGRLWSSLITSDGRPMPLTLSRKDAGPVYQWMREFLKSEKKPAEVDVLTDFQHFENKLHEWKPTRNIGVHTQKEFDLDQAFCRDFKVIEHNLQRTLMMDLVDRWYLPKEFLFYAEGRWELTWARKITPTKGADTPEPEYSVESYELPRVNTQDKFLKRPVPDFAIYFDRKQLAADDNIARYATPPAELKTTLSPDKSVRRCFPFMFIEAKQTLNNITPALLHNQLNASQALYNIYHWMREVDMQREFFEQVRTITISLNASDVVIRVHRPVKVGIDILEYRYQDLASWSNYRRNEVIPIIRNLLIQYGQEKLFKLLSQVYCKVVRTCLQSPPKRPISAILGNGPKRMRQDPTVEDESEEEEEDGLVEVERDATEQPQSVGGSFGASGLMLHDREQTRGGGGVERRRRAGRGRYSTR